MTAARSPDPLRDAILSAWECVIPESGAVYLGGPITTGPRLIDARLRNPEASDVFERLIAENGDELRRAALLLRKRRNEVVVEPSSLRIRGWSQPDYYRFWQIFIEKHVRLVVFMPHWQYSIGCAREFMHAIACDIPVETLSGMPITAGQGVADIAAASERLVAYDGHPELVEIGRQLADIARELARPARPPTGIESGDLRKDEALNRLANAGMNVAQFVAFGPLDGAPAQTYNRIAGHDPNRPFADLRAALETLLAASSDGSINVRSYEPHNPQSREFLYGLTSVESAAAAITRLTAQGLHTIANETIDVSDGGVSGVLMGDVLEFAPDDTPRCVEKPGIASLSRHLGCEILATVYGFPVDFETPLLSRLEFSLHPRPRGWKNTNIIAWEYSSLSKVDVHAQTTWPNKFSRLIGDKTFGLLVAHHIGLPVPWTIVMNRRIAPFEFGQLTDWDERWIRTAPPMQMPGLFTTHRGWTDPFALMKSEDPDGRNIASVLSQAGVKPYCSGALIVSADGETIIEGRFGAGDTLMSGDSEPEPLPSPVLRDVKALFEQASATLGPVRFEWVHDGKRAWIVQLHRGTTNSSYGRLVPGEAESWREFDVGEGLPALRLFLAQIPPGTGLILSGRVGLTSHIADTIRKAAIPARMAN